MSERFDPGSQLLFASNAQHLLWAMNLRGIESISRAVDVSSSILRRCQATHRPSLRVSPADCTSGAVPTTLAIVR
jgi:hypothetical protein